VKKRRKPIVMVIPGAIFTVTFAETQLPPQKIIAMMSIA
jgi:hypothetical protein